MRVLIDIRYRTRSGATRSLENVTRAIVSGPPGRHDVLVLKWHDQEYAWLASACTISVRKGSLARQLVWDQLALPRLLSKREVDIYHAMKSLGPLFMRSKRILVARSITLPFRGEFPASLPRRLYWNLIGSWMYRRADAIVAVSGFLREFLLEAVGVDADRIYVAHNGVDAAFCQLSLPQTGVLSPHPRPYVLVVGNIVPVKNTLTAVHAFRLIAEDLPDHSLVIAGRCEGAYAKQVTNAVAAAGLSHRVSFEGYCDDGRLVDLYRNARIMLLPSLSEGCPNALIEAMTCGLPALASNRGGIPEIAGDAAALIDDPEDAEAWAAQLAALLADEPRLAAMRSTALDRAGRYTWKASAAEVGRLYDALAAQN